MLIYVRKEIPGYYLDTEEYIDPEYWEGWIGYTYEDFLDNKWVLLSQDKVDYHDSHPNASIEEVFNLGPKPRTLEQAKAEMIELIDEYDQSSNVNGFIINNSIEGWFTPYERSNYRSSIDAAKRLGVETLSVIISNQIFTVPTETAELVLDQVQLYADRCFLVTKQHKMQVMSLDTIEDVDAFPYTQGYPQKLNFTYEIPEN